MPLAAVGLRLAWRAQLSNPRHGDDVVVDEEAKLALWRGRFAEPVSGWDFSPFDGSIETDEPPWSYDTLARDALVGATSAVDIGTGGGEVLLRLTDALPDDTFATEGWPPNLPVATEALAPHGIVVVPYDSEHDERMPFEDERFDVVLDRHESYVATEIFRILKPDGVFLTQQVDGRDFGETHGLFGGTPAYSHVTLENFRAEAEVVGFVVEDAREWTGTMRFADVATFVSYLRMVPWEVPDDFSVDHYSDQLLAMSDADLVFTRRMFVWRVDVPAGSQVAALDGRHVVGGEVVAGALCRRWPTPDAGPVVAADQDGMARACRRTSPGRGRRDRSRPPPRGVPRRQSGREGRRV